jgi:hypothetical protein
MELLLRARPTVSPQHATAAPSLRWDAHLSFHWQDSANRVQQKHEMSVVVRDRSFNSLTLNGAQVVSRGPLSIQERTFRTDDASQELTTSIKSISNRVKRIEERVARTEAVTVVRVNAETKSEPARMEHSSRALPAGGEIHSSWAQPRQAEASSISVERITDNVIRQLDHRITAWRERMGRG